MSLDVKDYPRVDVPGLLPGFVGRDTGVNLIIQHSRSGLFVVLPVPAPQNMVKKACAMISRRLAP